VASRALPDDELERLATWPPEVSRADLVAHFTLSLDDARWARSFRSPSARADRLGLAVQLCALRFLGFVPADLAAAPGEVVQRLADQLGVPAGGLSRYADQVSGRSRREHVALVVARAGWRACGRGEWKALGDWLVARALEHDTASVLFALALEHLRAEHVVRPGLDRLVRAVATARANAAEEVHRRLGPVLGPERRAQLDALVDTDPELGVAPLVWLGDGATSASPESVKAEVAKLAFLRDLGADRLDLSAVPPERLRHLASLARRSAPRALRQMAPERRHPVLLAAVAHGYTEVTDEIVRLFDQAMAATDSRARHRMVARQAELVQADAQRLVLLEEILDVVLDEDLDDAGVGATLRGLGTERLAAAARDDDERLPRDSGHLELMEASFSHVRSFASTPGPRSAQFCRQRGPERGPGGNPAAPSDERGRPPPRTRRRPGGVRPGPLEGLPRRRPCCRGREPLQALLGAVRARCPPRRAPLGGDLGARLQTLRQPRLLPHQS